MISKRYLLQRYTQGIVILVSLLCLVSWGNLALDIGTPFGGYLTVRNIMGNHSRVHMVTPEWWPGIHHTELSQGNIIHTIDGIPYDAPIARTIYAEKARQNQSVILEVDNLPPITITSTPFTRWQFWDLKLPDMVISISFLLLAWALVGTDNRHPQKVNLVVALIACQIAFNFGTHRPSLYWHDDIIAQLIDAIYVVSFPLIAGLTIHFTFLFPFEINWKLQKWIILAGYLISIGVGIIYLTSRLLLWCFNFPEQHIWVYNTDYLGYYGTYYTMTTAIVLLILRLFVVALPRKNLHLAIYQRESRIFLIAIFLQLPLMLGVGTDIFFGGKNTMFWQMLDTRYIFLLFPSAIVALIINNQTLQTNIHIPVQIFTLGIAATTANLLTAAVIASQPLLFDDIQASPFAVILPIVLLYTVFLQNTTGDKGLLGKIFNWERRQYQIIREFGSFLFHTSDLHNLPEHITQAVESTLEVKRTALWIYEQDQYLLVNARGEWNPSYPLPQILSESISDAASTYPYSVQKLKLDAPYFSADDLLLKLSFNNMVIGILVIGEPAYQRRFTVQDIEIIGLLGQQITLFMLTNVQYRRLTEINRDLHDGIKQDLSRVQAMLDHAQTNLAQESTPQATTQSIHKSIEFIAQVAGDVSKLLTPSRPDDDFLQLVTKHIRSFEKRNKHVAIFKNIRPEDANQLRDIHVIKQWSAIIRQALDNIEQHAEATEVEITLILNDSAQFVLTIEDNGEGIPTKYLNPRTRGSHHGLMNIENRARDVGTFEIQTRHTQPSYEGTRIILSTSL